MREHEKQKTDFDEKYTCRVVGDGVLAHVAMIGQLTILFLFREEWKNEIETRNKKQKRYSYRLPVAEANTNPGLYFQTMTNE